jgi:enamine deaminase RidA (YjgF/YER057c/UK114 family)
MPYFFNPETVWSPASRYSHGATHALNGRRLVISGQIGIDREGNVPKGLEAQLEIAWANVLAILHAADMKIENLVKVTAFCTLPDGVGAFREARDAALKGHAPATTYLQVAGLAGPEFVIEIEAEAVSEDA